MHKKRKQNNANYINVIKIVISFIVCHSFFLYVYRTLHRASQAAHIALGIYTSAKIA